MKLKILILALTVFSISSPAFAQYSDSYGGSFNNPISSSLSSSIWGNLQSQMNLQMQRSLAQSSARNRGNRGVPAQAVPATATLFKPGAGPVAPKALSLALTEDPKKRADYEKLFALCLQVYRQAGSKIAGSSEKNLSSDVAGGLAYFVAISYYVCAQNDQSLPQDISDAQYAALVRNVRTFLVSQESFSNLTNQERQLFHETLIITATLPLVAQIEAVKQNDQPGVANAVRLARENLARVGATPERLRFTDEGVEIR